MSDLPPDIAEAIEALETAAEQFGGQTWIGPEGAPAVVGARAALEAVILKHLPQPRPELSAEDAEALRMGGDR